MVSANVNNNFEVVCISLEVYTYFPSGVLLCPC